MPMFYQLQTSSTTGKFMNRALWQQHLAQAERAVAEGDRHIAMQRKIVAKFEERGHDSQSARDLLARFESLQALHIDHRDRLREDLVA